MDDNFSPKVRDVITFSKEEALRLGHEFIGTEHLVLGLIRKGEGKAIEILTTFDVDLVLLRKKLEQLNPSNPTFSDNKDKPSNTKKEQPQRKDMVGISPYIDLNSTMALLNSKRKKTDEPGTRLKEICAPIAAGTTKDTNNHCRQHQSPTQAPPC